MSDVALVQSDDGGEITIENGIAEMSEGLYSATYLSLFGGNADDSGRQGDDRKQWWGNLGETEPSKQYRSETQNLLRGLPLNTGNMSRIREAAERDLAWMLQSLATDVDVGISMPALNTITIRVLITIDDKVFPFEFTRGA